MNAIVDFLRPALPFRPSLAVVLGSGLGAFADALDEAQSIPYRDIPGWPKSTAVGHAGKLVFGKLGGVGLAVMAGRVHLYEGYTAAQVALPLRVLGKLGVRGVVLTNAAGGINPAFSPGTLALISDHINLQGQNPLTGPNDDSLGPRFPDMSDVYSRRWRAQAREAAADIGLTMPEGVYAGLLGPSYETPAEIRYLRAIGADLVGMSTIAEAVVARHMGIEVLGISCVTNFAAGVIDEKLDHAGVLAIGEQGRDTIVNLLRGVLPRLAAMQAGE